MQGGRTGADFSAYGNALVTAQQAFLVIVIYWLIISKFFDEDNVLQRLLPARVHFLRYCAVFQGAWVGGVLIVFGLCILFPTINLFGAFGQKREIERRQLWQKHFLEHVRPERFRRAHQALYQNRPPAPPAAL